jgi:hypothetical protein
MESARKTEDLLPGIKRKSRIVVTRRAGSRLFSAGRLKSTGAPRKLKILF